MDHLQFFGKAQATVNSDESRSSPKAKEGSRKKQSMGSEGSDKSEAQTKYSIEIEHTSSEDNVLMSPLTEHTLECSPAMFKRRFSVGSSTKKLLSKLKLNTGSAEHINSFKGRRI